jgi:hypothetical protein
MSRSYEEIREINRDTEIPRRCTVCACLDGAGVCTAATNLEGVELDDIAPPDDLVERSMYCDAVDYAEITINSAGISLILIKTRENESEILGECISLDNWESVKALLMNLHDREVVIGVKS